MEFYTMIDWCAIFLENLYVQYAPHLLTKYYKHKTTNKKKKLKTHKQDKTKGGDKIRQVKLKTQRE